MYPSRQTHCSGDTIQKCQLCLLPEPFLPTESQFGFVSELVGESKRQSGSCQFTQGTISPGCFGQEAHGAHLQDRICTPLIHSRGLKVAQENFPVKLLYFLGLLLSPATLVWPQRKGMCWIHDWGNRANVQSYQLRSAQLTGFHSHDGVGRTAHVCALG